MHDPFLELCIVEDLEKHTVALLLVRVNRPPVSVRTVVYLI